MLLLSLLFLILIQIELGQVLLVEAVETENLLLLYLSVKVY
jgi:hypothetical protein